MSRHFILLYGVISYILFLLVFLYAIGFIGNFVVPVSIDSPPRTPVNVSIVVNLCLLGLFALQHSIMARPAFKRWWTKFIPQAAERSTYVLFSNLALILLFVFWQPLGGVIWEVSNPLGRYVLYGLFAFGWLLVLVSTLLINHFDLFGLRQVWLYYRGVDYTPLPFGTPFLYKAIRHPLYVGWFFAFWATPTMSAAHLLFAIMSTVYILIAVRLEEKDLVEFLPEYTDYRSRVPMFLPRLFGK
ncbi:MAG: isoprenylcysteine carboxylmethyltransferase family protein [Pseudomonadales bacterium]|nr:isoprenylcysteine carboxylmethyltransferase family protein [Pseudomonadales bacterium]